MNGYQKKWGKALWKQIKDEQSPPQSKPRPKAIRRYTPARAREIARYNRRWPIWLTEWIMLHGPWCPVIYAIHGRMIRVSQCHHKRGRRGKLLLLERWWLAVSIEGHDWIHKNIALAMVHGWICDAGKWNLLDERAD